MAWKKKHADRIRKEREGDSRLVTLSFEERVEHDRKYLALLAATRDENMARWNAEREAIKANKERDEQIRQIVFYALSFIL